MDHINFTYYLEIQIITENCILKHKIVIQKADRHKSQGHKCRLGLTQAVESKNCYPFYLDSNPNSEVFTLSESIVVEALPEP